MCCILVATLMGCGDAVEKVSLDTVNADGIVETLVPEGVASAALAHPLQVALGGDQLSVWTPAGAELRSPVAHDVRTAAWHEDGLLIATSDGVVHGTEVFGPSGLAEGVQLPIVRMEREGTDLWVEGSDGLYLLRDGWLHAVRVEDEPVQGAWAVHDGEVWVARAEDTVVLQEDGGWQVTAVHPVVATQLAVTNEAVWALTETSLMRFSGGWSTVEVTAATMLARGNAVWLDGPRRVSAELDAPIHDLGLTGRLVGVDDAGRAWLTDDGALVRADIERRALWVASQGVLTVPTTLPLSISEVALVDTVTASLDDVELTVATDPWSVEVDPGGLLEGPHTLTATVTWNDGNTITTSTTIHAPAITEATWAEHVEPMAQKRCSVCHDGGTETVLHGRDLWVELFDAVLEEVESGRMPLGGASLTTSEIDMLLLWRDGGFP